MRVAFAGVREKHLPSVRRLETRFAAQENENAGPEQAPTRCFSLHQLLQLTGWRR